MLKHAFTAICLVLFCATPPIFGDATQTQTADTVSAETLITAENLASAYEWTYGKSLEFQLVVPETENAAEIPAKTQATNGMLTAPVFDYLDHLGKFVISDQDIPKAVYDTYAKLPAVQAEFHVKKEILIMIDALNLKLPEKRRIKLNSIIISYGTGIPNGKCEIVTAKHLSDGEGIEEFLSRQFGYDGPWYDECVVHVRFRIGSSLIYTFPMVQVLEDQKDRMKLKINPAAFWNTVRQETDPQKQSIYRKIFALLMIGVEITTANVGDTVYLAGYQGMSTMEGTPLVPFIFTGTMIININGQLLLKQGVEPGYSGGAIITADGKVVGMSLTITSGRQFTGGIEINDLLPKK